jgi:tetratricopeptide (TPR) repeat protein
MFREDVMRNLLVPATAALLGLATSAVAMGGGGGGSYGGNFGAPAATFDDYATAKRLIRHEQYAQAIPHLESALEKHPRDADVLNYLGFTHRMVGMTYADAGRDGEFKMSLDYYQRALAIDPNHKGVHEYLGELYLQMHDMMSAQKEQATLASLCPSGCDERATLDKAIAAYAPAPAAATPAAATPAAATPGASVPSPTP